MEDEIVVEAPAAEAAPVAQEPPRELRSTADALAELERREAVRRSAAKAEKAKADEPKAEAQAPAVEDSDEEGDDEIPEAKASDELDDDAEENAEDDAEDIEAQITVTFGGKELEIPKGTPKALVDAVQKMAGNLEADYTRKTQEAAEVRKRTEAQAEQTKKAFADLQQAQMAVAKMAEQMVGQPPPIELAQTDPGAYVLQKEMFEQRLRVLGHLRQGQGDLTKRQQQEMEQARAAEIADEQEKLVKALPALADPVKRQDFGRQALEVIGQFGFSAEELGAVGDHRMLLMINRLTELEKAEKARKQVSGSLRSKIDATPPKTLKPGAANPSGGREKAAKVKAEFMRSGRTLKDAMRAVDRLG